MQDDTTIPEPVDEATKPMVVGHILIRDGDTGAVIVNQRDNMIRQLTAVVEPTDDV